MVFRECSKITTFCPQWFTIPHRFELASKPINIIITIYYDSVYTLAQYLN